MSLVIFKLMTAYRPDICSHCQHDILRGASIGYSHSPHSVLCASCFGEVIKDAKPYHGGLYVVKVEETE